MRLLNRAVAIGSALVAAITVYEKLEEKLKALKERKK